MLFKTTVGSFALLALVAAQHQEPKIEGDPAAHAEEMYKSSCIQCHPVPDARFQTDRAWLQQVYDTA